MPPTDLESAVATFRNPELAPQPLLPGRFPLDLRARLQSIERRHRWRSFLHMLKACASHLVLEGDEPSDESSK